MVLNAVAPPLDTVHLRPQLSRPMDPVEEFTTIESIFVRERNALLIRGQFTPIYTDYYLHLMQHGIRHGEELDSMVKDQLAMLTLHLVARPWAETVAWTTNLRAPRLNLFVTGSNFNLVLFLFFFHRFLLGLEFHSLLLQCFSQLHAIKHFCF